MDELQEKINAALAKGVPMEDIANHLSSHSNPDYQSYGQSWIESSMAAPTKKSDYQKTDAGTAAPANIQTKLLDFIDENPKEALGYAAALYGATKIPKIVSGITDYRLKRRELDLKEKSLAAYEQQVSRQGMGASNPDAIVDMGKQFSEEDALKNQRQNLQDQIAQERLKQAQLKTQRAEIEHQNWVAKNTLSEAEQAFGRKAKDPAELRLMQTAVQQQAGKSPVAPTTAGPAQMTELPVIQSPATPAAQTWGAPVNQAPVAPANVAPTPVPPPAAPIETTPTITQPANVLSTGPTAESAEAPIKQAEVVKEAVTPTAEKPKAKTEPKIPKPEFFKNAPSAERWMYGSMTKYMDQPISAQAVVARAADYLPEGTKFEMQPGGEGGGIHPDQKQHLNRFVSEQLGIPLKEGKLPDDFKFTTENRNKLAASVQTELETHAKAGTLSKLGKGAMAAATLLGISEAVKAAQKGDFGPLQEAGFDIGLSAIPHPAVQAIVTGLTGTTLQPGTFPTTKAQAFERAVLNRKGIKEELTQMTKGKTGEEFNAIRDQYLYSNPRAVSDYDRAVKFFQSQAKQPVVPR
jgi:hypothetical protein